MMGYAMKKLAITVIMAMSMNLLSGAEDTRRLEQAIANVITNMDQAKFMPVRSPAWQYDYGLDGGGILNTYEYLHSLVSFEELQNLLPMDIYLSGPHDRSDLNLTSRDSFGHYNPEFVHFFHQAVNQILSEREFVNTTHDMVDRYLLGLLERLQRIYIHIEENPEEFQQFKRNYAQQLAAGTWPEGGYYENMPDSLNSDEYWNWSETAYYFWIRRDLDGTAEQWIDIINTILSAYS